MGSEGMELNELLGTLTPDVTFRPNDGAFRSKLVETVLDKSDEEYVELFSENSSDIIVGISGRTVAEALIQFRVVCDQGEKSLKLPLSMLNDEELTDVQEQLVVLSTRQPQPVPHDTHNSIVRKKAVTGMLTIKAASSRLGCSEQFLKGRIPCTDYTYTEVNGKKEIEEYYWSHDLINRLLQIKENGAKAEDLKHIAEECCYGDRTWAEEILTSLSSPKTMASTGGTSPQGVTKQPAKTPFKGNPHQRSARKKHS